MNADKEKEDERLKKITEQVIGAAFKVSNTLGVGFLEKVYRNALAYEIRKCGLNVLQEQPIIVKYENVVVGDYHADLLIENCVIVELKVAKAFDDIHAAQCLNYLRATGLKICLLINFGLPRIEIKRIVLNA